MEVHCLFETKLLPQNTHLKSFFLLWIKVTCWFNFCFEVKQIHSSFMGWFNIDFQVIFARATIITNFTFKSHFLPLWTDFFCFFRSLFWEQLHPQVSHLYSFFPLCVEEAWWFIVRFEIKLLPRNSHLYGFFPLCIEETWLFIA